MNLKCVLKLWLALAIPITLLCGVLYAVGQHMLRSGANDPQIQMAEDTARALGRGESISAVVPGGTFDIGRSYAAFLTVYDDAGQPLASSGHLHDRMPVIPSGIFDYVRSHGEERVTWQPEPGIRMATVVTRFDGAAAGFVMAGRSLSLIEQRISEIELLAAAGWVGTLAAALVSIFVIEGLALASK